MLQESPSAAERACARVGRDKLGGREREREGGWTGGTGTSPRAFLTVSALVGDQRSARYARERGGGGNGGCESESAESKPKVKFLKVSAGGRQTYGLTIFGPLCVYFAPVERAFRARPLFAGTAGRYGEAHLALSSQRASFVRTAGQPPSGVIRRKQSVQSRVSISLVSSKGVVPEFRAPCLG